MTRALAYLIQIQSGASLGPGFFDREGSRAGLDHWLVEVLAAVKVALVRAIQTARDRRCRDNAIRGLHELTDRQLDDIGLTRGQIRPVIEGKLRQVGGRSARSGFRQVRLGVSSCNEALRRAA